MNNPRRKALNKIKDQIEDLKMALEELLEEEQEAFDNMPEGLQYSEKGEKMEENISALEDAVSNLEESIDNIDTAIEQKGASEMNVYIIDTGRQNDNRYQIMTGGNGMFCHLYPGKLFTLEQATAICKENNYNVIKVGSMWECVSK